MKLPPLVLALGASALLLSACGRTSRGGGGGGGDDDSASDDETGADDDTSVGDDDATAADDDTTPGDDDDTEGTWSGQLSGSLTLGVIDSGVACAGPGSLSGSAAAVDGTLVCDLSIGNPCSVTVVGQALNGAPIAVVPSCFPLTADLSLTLSGGDVYVDLYGAGNDVRVGDYVFVVEGVLSPP
jgi:hypothetical protein